MRQETITLSGSEVASGILKEMVDINATKEMTWV